MGKKKNIKDLSQSVEKETVIVTPAKKAIPWYSLRGIIMQALVLVIVGLVCFGNSFYNEYALDDDIIIVKNEYVQEGFKGIPKILTSDAMASFYEQFAADQQLSGGRYRPLSIVTFAIEQQFFGPKITAEEKQLFGKKEAKLSKKLAFVRHFSNVVLYILSVITLLYFLRNFIFKHNIFIPFLASLLFIIHPIHTEVVANVKSRDEIFSLLFIVLTFISAFRYYETQKKRDLYGGLLFYFLAFLSKEYAITLLILIPMLFCIVKKDTIWKAIGKTMPFVLVAIFYILIRVAIVGLGSSVENTEILNNPFLYASNIEKLATKIDILSHYLKLLFYPNVLSSDYSYDTIPYSDFSSGWVWLSFLIHIGMLVLAIVLFRKRNILSFALAFYLLHLFLVSNLMFDLGATMGERLVYHSSLGFVIIISVAIDWLLKKINSLMFRRITGVAICSLLVYWCAAKDIERNAEWKDNGTLFLADVKKVPNSILANGNAAKGLIDLSMLSNDSIERVKLLDTAVVYLKRATSLHNEYVAGYSNLGYAYFLLKEYDKAKENWDVVKRVYPMSPFLPAYYADLGAVYSNDGIEKLKIDPPKAVKLFEKAVECVPTNIDFLNNLGMGYYFVEKNYDKARQTWQKSLQIKPGNKVALDGMALFNKQ